MRTALTVITTAILTAIAFLLARQNGWLGTISSLTTCPTTDTPGDCLQVADGASCTTPWGDTVAHGEAILSFSEETPGEDETCESITSICNDGTWLDDLAPSAYKTCTLDANTNIMQPCVVGDILVPHDSTNTFYLETRNSNGSYTYQSQQRYCFDGEMDGDATYDKVNLISSCTLQVTDTEEEVVEEETESKTVNTIAPPNQATTAPVTNYPDSLKYARCDAPFGGVREHGKGGNVYLQASVPFGQSCQATAIVCGYGTLRFGTAEAIGDPVGQQVFSSCVVSEPVGCTSACGEVSHGAKIVSYSKGTLPFGSEQSCEDIKITSTCSNGTLSPQSGSACSCAVEAPASCTAPNGQIIAHNASLTLYQYPEVQAVAGDGSDTCIRQWRQCVNGDFRDYNGTSASFTFKYPTCTVLPPPEGGGEGGEGIPKG